MTSGVNGSNPYRAKNWRKQNFDQTFNNMRYNDGFGHQYYIDASGNSIFTQQQSKSQHSFLGGVMDGMFGALGIDTSSGEMTGASIANMAMSMIMLGVLKADKTSSAQSETKKVSDFVHEIAETSGRKIENACADFNTKYAKYNITISNTGEVTGDFASAKSDLETRKANLEKRVSSTGDKSKLESYESAKSKYDTLVSVQKRQTDLTNTLKTLANNPKIDTSSGEAVAKLDPKDYEKYIDLKDPNADKAELATQTSHYQNDKTQAEKDVKTYNDTKHELDKLNKEHPNLQKEIDDAKSVMDTAGTAEFDDGTNVDDYKTELADIESKLGNIGTKAEFDAAKKKVTDLVQAQKEAQAGLDLETRTEEDKRASASDKKAAKRAKGGGKRTALGRAWYDAWHSDKKTYVKKDSEGNWVSAKKGENGAISAAELKKKSKASQLAYNQSASALNSYLEGIATGKNPKEEDA